MSKGLFSFWKVGRSKVSYPYVNHYSFHILDPDWGHLTIKLSSHPPFPAQIILNGHEYVEWQARTAGLAFTKEGNCFTTVPDDIRFAGLHFGETQFPAFVERNPWIGQASIRRKIWILLDPKPKAPGSPSTTVGGFGRRTSTACTQTSRDAKPKISHHKTIKWQ